MMIISYDYFFFQTFFLKFVLMPHALYVVIKYIPNIFLLTCKINTNVNTIETRYTQQEIFTAQLRPTTSFIKYEIL